MSKESVFTALFKDTACVRISGRGTFLNSHPIKSWLLSKIEEGCSSFIIDLAECKSMDSTFMGAITGISLKMKRLGRSPVTLANITAHNKRLLETLGLDRFFVLEEKFEMNMNLAWEKLYIESLDKLETTKHMMESHEQLMDSGGTAKKEFKTVHDMIKKDLEKQMKKKPETRNHG